MPSWTLALLTLTAFTVVALGGLYLTRRFISRRLIFSRDINDAVNYFGSALATLYSVTLGLIAVASWQNYDEVEKLVSHEASTIAVVYRDVGGYPEPLRTQMRQHLREYINFIVEKAWPAQQQNLLLDDATYMVAEMHDILFSYEPTTMGQQVAHAEAMRKFNEMIDLRRQRVDRVDDGLPNVLWVVVAIGGLLTMFVTYFFWIEDLRFHMLLLATLSILVSLMVYLIAALDRPFRGKVSVTPESYQLIIQKVMDPLDEAGKPGATGGRPVGAALSR